MRSTTPPGNKRTRQGLLARLRAAIRARFWPTYEDLLERKAELREAVLFWRYPNGMIVPPEKRRRLMSKLNRLDRELRHHPDNPDNR
jgi:hypothetical protein